MRRASGCLFGLAFGDALGAPTEFLSVEAILKRFPPNGPEYPEGNPALVTDDTQMAIALGMALYHLAPPLIPTKLEESIRREFLIWLNSPDNNRAPGNTCLEACYALEEGKRWVDASVINSKGCGANMRVAPVGLLPADKYQLTEADYAGIAQLQGAMTHGHPTALAAADLTVRTIVDLKKGGDLAGLPKRLRDYALTQRNLYHEQWLGDLWLKPMIFPTAEAYIAHGWDECIALFDRLEQALLRPQRDIDPCLLTGKGWIAEEAFMTGLLCLLYFPDDPIAALRRAAVSSGDSDSIACLTGAFAGTRYGLDAFPHDWVERIEYKDQLHRLGSAWD